MNILLLLTIPSLAEIIITIVFTNKLYARNNKWEGLYIFVFVLMAIVMCKFFIQWQIIVSITSLLLLFIALKIYTKESSKDIFLGYILLTIFTVLFVQVPTIPLVKAFQNNKLLPIIHSGIFVVWGLFLIHILPLRKFYGFIRKQKIHTYLILADCGIFTLFIMWYSQIQRTQFFEHIILYVFFSVITLFINVEIYISMIRIAEQKERVKIYEEYLPILDEMILAVRKRQHSYDNKLQAIQALPNTCKTYEELVAKLNDSALKYQFSSLPTYLLKTNLTIVAGYLYKKCTEASKNNRQMNIMLTNKDLPTSIPQYELIDLLGILIDNSLEAIPKNGCFDLIIDTSINGKIVITTKNQGPFVSSDLIKKMFTVGYSTKHLPNEAKRGLGLSYLKEYVDSHNGEISITNESIDGVNNIVFSVEV